MSVQTTIADFRIDVGCDAVQLPDAVAIRYYNDSRDIVIDKIINAKEDWFYNELTVDTVAGQREYALPKRGDLAEDAVTVLDGIKKIKQVGVKFLSTDTEYTKVEPEVIGNLDYDPLSYDESVNAFYTLSDNSLFLYPTPTEAIDSGIIVYAIMEPKRLVLADNETLPDSVSKVILLGLAQRWFRSQKMREDASAAEVEFVRELNRVVDSLSGRLQEPKTIQIPYV